MQETPLFSYCDPSTMWYLCNKSG